MKSWMQRAREASGLAPSECARTLKLSVNDYLIRENNPGMLTIDELAALTFDFNEEARGIVAKGICACLL